IKSSSPVPAGFRNLLEGLAREVLREQPTDIVAFAAEYFQRLLEQREGECPCPAPTPTLPSPHQASLVCP
uniref:RIIa domain-containing protein n=1 Tax=Malurus cyaneus samueli TaxID=2593467 RepID=A0A8C5TDH5_9PASS